MQVSLTVKEGENPIQELCPFLPIPVADCKTTFCLTFKEKSKASHSRSLPSTAFCSKIKVESFVVYIPLNDLEISR